MDVTTEMLGTLDMIFLLCYSLSLAIIGNFTHHIDIKYFLFCGLCPASLAFLSIGIMGFAGF